MTEKEKLELRTLKRRYGQQPGANFSQLSKKKDNELIDDRETSPRCRNIVYVKPKEQR